jgi:hypothetical protein
MEAEAVDPVYDPDLPMLGEALDRARMDAQLRPMMPEAGPLESIRLIKHRPGRRCVIAYTFAGIGHGRGHGRGHGGDVSPQTAFGKIRKKGMDLRTQELLEALWAAGFRPGSGATVFVPEPLGVVPELRMTVQRGGLGEPVSDRLLRDDSVALMPGVAAAIHALHDAGPAVDRHHSLTDELAILEDRLAALGERRSELAPRLERLLAASRRLARGLESDRRVGIHRDFYADQILTDGDHFTLIDLDLYTMGDPALDVGNFGAHLTELALRTGGSAEGLEDRERALFDHYRALSPAVPEAALRDWATLTLVRHVSISSLMPGRTHTTEALLDLCEQRLAVHC